jgi:hypothetical protein
MLIESATFNHFVCLYWKHFALLWTKTFSTRNQMPKIINAFFVIFWKWKEISSWQIYKTSKTSKILKLKIECCSYINKLKCLFDYSELWRSLYKNHDIRRRSKISNFVWMIVKVDQCFMNMSLWKINDSKLNYIFNEQKNNWTFFFGQG